MPKSLTPDCDKLPEAAQVHARAFLAVAKPYNATEVARVLTNLNGGVDYMGCGKDHCAASYAKAMIGQKVGLSDCGSEALQALTLDRLGELLKAERTRLANGRRAKVENEARWTREHKERQARQAARTLAADRWQALVEHDMLAKLGEGFPLFPSLAELTALVDAKLAELRGGA